MTTTLDEAQSLLEHCCAWSGDTGCGDSCQHGHPVQPPFRAEDPGALPERGVLSASVQRELAEIAGSHPRPENAVRILVNGAQSFGAMLDLIRSAEADVRLENFIFREDAVGRVFARELRASASAGIDVRVLHDPLGAIMARRRPADLFLRGSNVDVRLFNLPFSRIASRRLGRDHRKLLAVDGRRMIVGGICLADPWAGNCIRHCTWRDSALQVEGPTAHEGARCFEDTWESGSRLFSRVDVSAVRTSLPKPEPAGGVPVRILADQGDERVLLPVLERVIDAAESDILITSPYFIPPRRLADALLRAASRGVEVSVLIPGTNNHRVAARSAEHRLGSLLTGGVSVFLWQGAMIHAKSVVVDQVWTLVGSSNLDSLSLERNAELNVEVHGSRVGAAMARLFREDCLISIPLTLAEWNSRSLSRRLGGGLAAVLSRWQ